MLNNQKPSMPVLIEDLGMQYPNEASTRKRHYVIYECVFCKNHYKSILQNNKYGCGCRQSSHNLSDSKLYFIWQNILQRINNKDNPHYKDYGGRGINICKEWKNDFMSFYNWAITNGYEEGLSIDRKENNGNYDPFNCRFVNQYVQTRNTRVLRSTNKSGYRGVSWHKEKMKWKATIRFNDKVKFLGYFSEAKDGAMAYDKFILENNMQNTRNFS